MLTKPKHTSRNRHRPVKSLIKALRILDALGDRPGGLGITDLSSALGAPKSTVHRLVATLEAAGYAVFDPPTARYVLGSRVAKLGEQLNYQIFLPNLALPAATANFQVRAHSKYFDHDGLLFTVSSQTTNALQNIFFASDIVTSYVDPKTLLPFHTEFSLNEGQRRFTSKLAINQDNGTATSEKGNRIEIPVGTHDYLSFFYALRTFNLTPPRRSAISILVDNKPKTLFISTLQKENVQLGSQSIPAIQISLTTDDEQSDK